MPWVIQESSDKKQSTLGGNGKTLQYTNHEDPMNRIKRQEKFVIYYSVIWASLIARLIKNPPAMRETSVRFLGWADPLEKDRLPTPVFLGFPCGSAGWELICNVGEFCSIPRLERFPWRRERLRTPVFWPGEFHGQSMGSQGVGHDSATFTFFLSVSDLGQKTTWELFYHWPDFKMTERISQPVTLRCRD